MEEIRKKDETGTELIPVKYNGETPTVLGRDLHAFLEVETPYHKWFPRMCEYGFVENADYATVDKNVLRVDGSKMPQTQHDHQLTIPMAKEIAMLQRTERGKMARQYFLRIEEQWNMPEAVMARALKLAEKHLEELKHLNYELAVKNEIMEPKADYFDELVERNLLTNFRETAKELKVKPKTFVSFLLEKKYIYRDKKGRLLPFQKYADSGLFEVKECFSQKTEWSGTQTLVTPKGRETFRLLVS